MNTKEYITSGILESYLLNLLSETERQEVEQAVKAYPEVREALHAVEDDLASYALAKAPPLSEALQEEVLQKIDSLDQGGGLKVQRNWAPMVIAAGFLVAALAVGLLYFYYQADKLETSLETAQQDLIQLQTDCDTQSTQLQSAQEQLSILRNAAYRTILLGGTDKLPQAVAAVYYNTEDNKSYLDIRNLPPPPAGQQYQLWAIVNDVPTDMGVFDLLAEGGLQEIPHINEAQAFAVTLEPTGGSAAPTMDQMVLIGNVG